LTPGGQERAVKFECTTLVLDLDGTISDPSLGITRCFNHALKIHGFPTVSNSAIAREIGPPLDETFMKLAPGLSASGVTDLIATYRERYSDTGYSENTLYPDIPDALHRLKEAGITLGVCTSKRRDFAERILSLFGLLDHFNFVNGGDIGISKQSQLTGLLNAKIIDNGAIMVGDRSVDIKSAQANGLCSIGVLWGFGDYAELAEASPSFILERVAELPGIVI
jgi:phosphoglycolate phosphatase